MRVCLLCILTLLFHVNSFASSPFSLEALQGVNVTFLNKNKLLSEAYTASLQKEVEEKLLKAGIVTNSKSFSNLLFKVQTQNVKETTLVHITLSLVENARLKRLHPIDAIAITYTKDDLFETRAMETDVKESILFLVDELIDQYKEENPPPKK